MEISDQKEGVESRGLKKDLIIYLVVYISFGLLGTLSVVWALFRAPEDLRPPSLEFFLSSVLSMYAVGFFISMLIGKWITSFLVGKFKKQHVTQGVVVENSSSIWGNLGFNLAIGVLLGASLAGSILCNNFVTLNDITTVLFCDVIASCLASFLVSFIIGLNCWLIYQVNSIEKETNQKMVVQYYSTRQWSWGVLVGATAVTVTVVVLMFYKIFTLGQP